MCLRRLNLLAAFLALVFSLSSARADAASILYATGVAVDLPPATSALYTIDPATGTATAVAGYAGVHFYNGGLVYDSTTDTFFATGFETTSPGESKLFAIDRVSAALVVVGSTGTGTGLNSGGLAIHPITGELYASGGVGSQSSGLFTLDKETGAATLIGLAGPVCCSAPVFGFNMNDLGFRSDGTLFANGYTLTATISEAAYSHLFTVDPVTGIATDIGSHGVAVGGQLAFSGIAFAEDGTLLSVGSTSASTIGLYAVDPATGASTLLRGLSPNFGGNGGLVFAPAVPEPTTALLLGGGLAALARRRRASRNR